MTDPDQPQPAQQPPEDAAPVRSSRWRWVAPVLSVAVLSWLVARVSNCDEAVEAEPKWLVTDEPASAPATTTDELVPLRGTKSFGIESPGEKAAAVEPAVAPAPVVADPVQPDPLVGEDLKYLGGSKSGIGGLGLSGRGRSSLGDPPPDAPPPEPAP